MSRKDNGGWFRTLFWRERSRWLEGMDSG